MRYAKKPVIIEAIQWTGENRDEIFQFAGRNASLGDATGMIIKTLEGEHKASEGDFIIKGIAGEFYPCKPDIFKATYQEVDE